MHGYLRAIGFSNQNVKKVISEIVNETIDGQFFNINKFNNNEDTFEIFKLIGEEIGIVIHGDILNNGDVEVDYIFPFAIPKQFKEYKEINVEKNSYNLSFSASCEELGIGVSIIFYLQNGLDYIKHASNSNKNTFKGKVGLVGMCLSGKIIMPIKKDYQISKAYDKLRDYRNSIIIKAKNGDEEAVENLTIDEMNAYTRIIKRVKTEDVLSVVDTSFIPYGIECDSYYIIGEIVKIDIITNIYTKEKIYCLGLNCNDLQLDIIINKKDLLGEAAIGRRFKGNVWMQGKVEFDE